ncbi:MULTISPECIES: DUF7331 family protein [Halorubrum]|uniref:Uncharacterized protein n=4 Tax=Halorubrum TaxID=56688 RepID=A0A8T8LKS9_9EURY|nr:MULTISPECIES: hypothetical protein [Halorubrum]ELZ50274.1 hypothetical protein C466_15162 [Halorubrum distributum JCM 10118]EMA60986.1 hypothetical protein C470_07931 [Halorubrum litoreum JCM 13561]EMA71226.1 hypothetical protein C462_08900 [Halorubrum arcis JCM 13916]MDV7349822.1 hypothetical protein [Halorubrum distributum]QUO47852.1 hypothetical protein J7656_00250 [Halorubrum ruber]
MSSDPRSEPQAARPADSDAVDAEVEAYEDDGNVVLFDATNPLAWVEASRTVRLADAV